MTDHAHPTSPRADFITSIACDRAGHSPSSSARWRCTASSSRAPSPTPRPGLVPGILGALLAVLGGVLRRCARCRACQAAGWARRGSRRRRTASAARFLLGAGLSLVYTLVLVGHGLPFWLGNGAVRLRLRLAVRPRAAQGRGPARCAWRSLGVSPAVVPLVDILRSAAHATLFARTHTSDRWPACPERRRAMFDGLVAFGHSIWTSSAPIVAGARAAVDAGRHRSSACSPASRPRWASR